MENKKEIIQQLRSKLPILRENGKSFVSIIDKVLLDYKNLTSPFFKNNSDYNKVTGFIDDVPKILDQYFQGHINKAYLIFKSNISRLLNEDRNGYTGVLPVYNKDYNSIYEINPDDFRYYFRISPFLSSFPHIPFEYREYIGSQRFTVPGLPCFYGGNTIETCITEIGASVEYDKYYVSCFDYDYPQVPILDLTLPKIKVGENDDYYDKAIFSWPLVALCMIKRSGNSADKNAKFIPEYIFPQFILKYLAESELSQIKAVRYFSTKFTDFETHINIAIPVQETKDNGHCEILKSLFNEGQRLISHQISGYSKPVKLSSLSGMDGSALINNIEYNY